MRVPISEAFKGGKSDPRNPILHQMFSYLGYGERAGSGLYNINAVWKEKGWEDPIIKETLNPNRTTLILNMKNVDRNVDRNVEKYFREIYPELTDNLIRIIEIIDKDKYIKQDEIAQKLNKTKNTIFRNIKTLKDLKIIERIGSTKKGYWKINL